MCRRGVALPRAKEFIRVERSPLELQAASLSLRSAAHAGTRGDCRSVVWLGMVQLSEGELDRILVRRERTDGDPDRALQSGRLATQPCLVGSTGGCLRPSSGWGA